MRALVSVLVVLLWVSSTWAELVNEKTYGICRVYTNRDAFTDEERHILTCESAIYSLWVTESRLDGDILLSVYFGTLFRTSVIDGTIAFRVDKGPVRAVQGWWRKGDNKAMTNDDRFIRSLLKALAKGQRMAVRVESDFKECIFSDLTGTALAVRDFLGRVDRKQVLEIPVRK